LSSFGHAFWKERGDMAIFSRRIIQEMIDENAAFLTEKQLDQHVSRLNRKNTKDFGSLDAEWEVLMLNIFGKIGKGSMSPIWGAPTS
jgi:hypothetical protein